MQSYKEYLKPPNKNHFIFNVLTFFNKKPYFNVLKCHKCPNINNIFPNKRQLL